MMKRFLLDLSTTDDSFFVSNSENGLIVLCLERFSIIWVYTTRKIAIETDVIWNWTFWKPVHQGPAASLFWLLADCNDWWRHESIQGRDFSIIYMKLETSNSQRIKGLQQLFCCCLQTAAGDEHMYSQQSFLNGQKGKLSPTHPTKRSQIHGRHQTSSTYQWLLTVPNFFYYGLPMLLLPFHIFLHKTSVAWEVVILLLSPFLCEGVTADQSGTEAKNLLPLKWPLLPFCEEVKNGLDLLWSPSFCEKWNGTKFWFLLLAHNKCYNENNSLVGLHHN